MAYKINDRSFLKAPIEGFVARYFFFLKRWMIKNATATKGIPIMQTVKMEIAEMINTRAIAMIKNKTSPITLTVIIINSFLKIYLMLIVTNK